MKQEELIKWIGELYRTHNIHAFYTSKIWRHTREETLKEQNYECQLCKKRGIHREATTVHHIKHLKEYPALALTKSNLMSVCYDCHNELHPEKADKFFKKYKAKQYLNEEKW